VIRGCRVLLSSGECTASEVAAISRARVAGPGHGRRHEADEPRDGREDDRSTRIFRRRHSSARNHSAHPLLYLIPRTAVLGAILLTRYLGGAIATHVRAGAGLFEILFPVIFATVIWGSIFLRDSRLRAIIPLRRNSERDSH
jgi:DoxX-like family